MALLRTVLTALIVCALAALPLSRAIAAAPSGTSSEAAGVIAMPMDCDEHHNGAMATDQNESSDQTFAKSGGHEGDHCPMHPMCGGKCVCLGLSLTAVLGPNASAPLAPLMGSPSSRLSAPLRAIAYVPPSPPPRA